MIRVLQFVRLKRIAGDLNLHVLTTRLNNSTGCLERCEGDQNYKLGLRHEATPETRQQLIRLIFRMQLTTF